MRQSHDNRGDTILSEGTVSHSPETNAAFFSVRFHKKPPSLARPLYPRRDALHVTHAGVAMRISGEKSDSFVFLALSSSSSLWSCSFPGPTGGHPWTQPLVP